MPRWRLLITPPLPGALNMAIDQALLEAYNVAQQPTLRFYGWSPACLSLGLAQKLDRDVDEAACVELGIELVRRPTGGRAILHDRELTYALVIAVDHPLIKGSGVVASYRAISEALCVGIRQLGLAPELAPRPSLRHPKSAACFDLASDYEITLQGRKLLGSAQARQNGVLLQHGSLLLHANVDQLVRVLRLPATLVRDDLARRLIALDEVLAKLPHFDEIVAALVGGFERTWGIELVLGSLTAAEERRAVQLARDKYADPGWTNRR